MRNRWQAQQNSVPRSASNNFSSYANGRLPPRSLVNDACQSIDPLAAPIKPLPTPTTATMKKTEREALLTLLQDRFEQNAHRHEGVQWSDVLARLESNASALDALQAMERSGGEPDVIAHDRETGQFTFCDCSRESPSGRRSLCYDDQALNDRKENKPLASAVAMAHEMGIELMTEQQYRTLQTLGEFDSKTSSWVSTPSDVRALGGALFCDRRYGKVFLYHNGAQSYYAARGFRGSLCV